MRLTFLANDFNNFTRYRDIALSQNIPDLDILEIQYVGMALDEQIGEEK